MLQYMTRWLLLTAVVVLTGCAHPISIQPKIENIDRMVGAPERFKGKVGYFIPQASFDLEVTTPAGGGDNVRYFPYRDIEAGFQRMLSNLFESVIRVSSMPTSLDMQREGITHVISPVLTTSSGSTGVFTWPPTNFSVDLTAQIRDAAGALVASPRAVGAASVGSILDMHGNFGLTGQLATQDALLKVQSLLHEAMSTKKQPSSAGAGGQLVTPGVAQPVSPAEERLRALRELRDKDLLTPEEYERRRQQIVNSL